MLLVKFRNLGGGERELLAIGQTKAPEFTGRRRRFGSEMRRTAGLLGEQYVSLEPGGDEQVLKAGDEIKLTQSALVLEQLIGQLLYSFTEGNSKE